MKSNSGLVQGKTHEALRHIRMWVHEQGAEWTEEDIDTAAWLLAHTEATIHADLMHPDFARAFYRSNRMKGVSRKSTLAGMATEFPAGTVEYVMRTERQ
jgi:hypothetical protein